MGIHFCVALHKHSAVTRRFTMTVTSVQRNHGNIELINSRTEELLGCIVHAASLCVRVKLTLVLQRFVSDVLGYINPLASYGPPPISHHYKSQSCACECVCVCSCACLLTFSLHSPERGDGGRVKSIPTFSLEISDLPCLLHFSLLQKLFSPFSTPFCCFFFFRASYCVRLS